MLDAKMQELRLQERDTPVQMDLKLLWASDKKLILHIWVHGDLNTATLNFSSQSLVQYSTYVTLSSASSTWATWPDKRRLRKTGRNAAARQTKRKGKPVRAPKFR